MGLSHIVNCGLSGFTMFFHIIKIFGENAWRIKYSDFLYNFCPKSLSFSEELSEI